MSEQRERGIVTRWRNSYGFIRPNDGTSDLFVHYSEVVMDGFRTLSEGQVVTYRRAVDPVKQRVRAIDVRLEGVAA